MTAIELAELTEYSRGYQDGLSRRGYNDRSTNTQGSLIVLGLCFRAHATAYACGYRDAIDYKGLVRLPEVTATA